MTQQTLDFSPVTPIQSWSLVQNFIIALQHVEDGERYSEVNSYYRLSGACDVLCCLGTAESSEMFKMAQMFAHYVRHHKKGDEYPPQIIGYFLAYGLRFSVGSVSSNA